MTSAHRQGGGAHDGHPQPSRRSRSVGGLLREWASYNLRATDDAQVVVATTRFLRLLMVALVVALASAVIYAHVNSGGVGARSPHCWQTSISAYYYTPAEGILVSVLVAVGIALVALQGNTELEDALLNLAGMFALLVALVPTPNPGVCGTITDTSHRNANIDNNVTAILLLAGTAFVVVGLLSVLGHPISSAAPGQRGAQTPPRRTRIRRWTYLLAVALYALTWGLFEGAKGWFRNDAHSFAAVAFFVSIFLTVVDNAISFYFTSETVDGVSRGRPATSGTCSKTMSRARRTSKINRYLIIALLMAVAVPFIKLAPIFGGYETLWLESTMIALFAAFWAIQTWELWDRGLRTATPSDQHRPVDPPLTRASDD